MTHRPWLRWTILAFLLSLSLYSLERVWPARSPQKRRSAAKSGSSATSPTWLRRMRRTEARHQGKRKAADYIAKEFKEAGLKPVGKDGTYFQPFKAAKQVNGQERDRRAGRDWSLSRRNGGRRRPL